MARPTALITGGAIRLGKAIAIHLAKANYDIALHYNGSAEAASETATEITKLGVNCKTYQCDFSQEIEFSSLLEQIISDFQNLQLLVNNASLYTQQTINEVNPQSFNDTFNINFRTPFLLTQTFAKLKKKGEIINIIDNKIGFNQFQYSIYLLSKKALAEFTQMAALEFAPDFKINGVAPGVVMPASSRSEDYIDWRLQGIPLGRQGNVANICRAIDYILENDFITGQILTVDGGESITNTGRNAADYAGADNE